MVTILEEYGQLSVMEAIHLPVGGESKGWNNHSLNTLITMIHRGDEHAKTERLLQVSLNITAPRYIWSELDTYIIGMTPGSSESTMYTLDKTLKNAKFYVDLHPLFEKGTNLRQVANLWDVYKSQLIELDRDTRVEYLKRMLPEGFLQTRVRQFSYQTLRRIYNQRKNHKLSWWSTFLNELIPQLKQQRLIKETWDLEEVIF